MIIKVRSYCKIIDRLNISIIILSLFLSFISLNNQREWTKFYGSMIDLRNKNNNIMDYISKTEQYFLNEIEHQHNIKKANPDDLIYIIKTNNKERKNFIALIVKEMSKGFDDGIYQRGY
tara:strand:+ start:478 stop:834 length:357 start_codon:yes stop_codon:yes gene_type:complete